MSHLEAKPRWERVPSLVLARLLARRRLLRKTRIRHLAAHFRRLLVFPQTFEAGLPHQIVGSPGTELNLRHQLGPHPKSTLGGRARHVYEGHLGLPHGFQLLTQLARVDLGETGARPSGIDQFLVVVIPQQKGADAIGSIIGLGEATDDKLLPANALDLDP